MLIYMSHYDQNPTRPTDDAPAEGDTVTLAGTPGVEWTVLRALNTTATIQNNATGGEGATYLANLTVIRRAGEI